MSNLHAEPASRAFLVIIAVSCQASRAACGDWIRVLLRQLPAGIRWVGFLVCCTVHTGVAWHWRVAALLYLSMFCMSAKQDGEP